MHKEPIHHYFLAFYETLHLLKNPNHIKKQLFLHLQATEQSAYFLSIVINKIYVEYAADVVMSASNESMLILRGRLSIKVLTDDATGTLFHKCLCYVLYLSRFADWGQLWPTDVI